MKLHIPAGLENSEMNEKLSPTIGHPKLPGIFSIVLGELHECNQKNVKASKVTRRMKNTTLMSSIADLLTTNLEGDN